MLQGEERLFPEGWWRDWLSDVEMGSLAVGRVENAYCAGDVEANSNNSVLSKKADRNYEDEKNIAVLHKGARYRKKRYRENL